MPKLTKIKTLPNFQILCFFKNGEQKILDCQKFLNDKYFQKIKENNFFQNAEIGECGEIYWKNVAEIKQLNGKLKPCHYDISSEFIYANSQKIKEKIF